MADRFVRDISNVTSTEWKAIRDAITDPDERQAFINDCCLRGKQALIDRGVRVNHG